MIGEAARGNTREICSTVQTARISRTFNLQALNFDSVLRRIMLMPSEAETGRRTDTATEKTNEVPLIHW